MPLFCFVMLPPTEIPVFSFCSVAVSVSASASSSSSTRYRDSYYCYILIIDIVSHSPSFFICLRSDFCSFRSYLRPNFIFWFACNSIKWVSCWVSEKGRVKSEERKKRQENICVNRSERETKDHRQIGKLRRRERERETSDWQGERAHATCVNQQHGIIIAEQNHRPPIDNTIFIWFVC